MARRTVLLLFYCLVPLLLLFAAPPALEAAVAVPIHDVQYTENPSGYSPYYGQEVTITGVVTTISYYGYVLAEGPGPWQAVFVYTFLNSPEVGDSVTVTGTVYEYYGMTEIVNVTGVQLNSSGHPVTATTVDVGDVSQEQYESVLVRVENVFVGAILDYGEWVVTDGSSYAICDDWNDYMYFPHMYDFLPSVTGTLNYSFGAFKIEPRDTADIGGAVPPSDHYALHGHIVTMNDDRDVIIGGYVEILGDEIVSVRTKRPENITVIQAGGLIFPGLIDAHNHPQYNVLDVIPFGTLFEDRWEWRDHPLYADFNLQLDNIMDFGGYSAQYLNVWKLAEVRSLTAGTTSIQGSNISGADYIGFAHPAMIVNNVGRFPERVLTDTFPLDDGAAYWQYTSMECWDRFIIHLSEGVNDAALAEFYEWQGFGVLDERTSIIHGIPYGEDEWAAMAAAGANLIWSPVSNLTLYGATAHVPGALAAGVDVALSADWTESGSRTILDEMKAADAYDNENWGDALSPQQLVEFVTRNAAHALGIEDRVGQIAPGYRADLMVVPGSPNKPYRALLRSDPANVKLTIVNGKALYGNPDLMEQFSYSDNAETIYVGGQEKSLAIRLDAPTIPESGKFFSQILAELETAYEAAEPKVCDFLGAGDETGPREP